MCAPPISTHDEMMIELCAYSAALLGHDSGLHMSALCRSARSARRLLCGGPLEHTADG